MKNLTSLSKFLSLVLRHKPEVIGITLDSHGWAKVDELINGIREQYDFDFETLKKIVETDNKQRYSFNDDKTLIRANQGHSIKVDVDLEELQPPKILYHGTAKKYEKSIDKSGLKSKSRLYVHLSADLETAEMVGKRHGELLIYEVDCGKMFDDGYKFYKSANGVWLTDIVPVQYLKKL